MSKCSICGNDLGMFAKDCKVSNGYLCAECLEKSEIKKPADQITIEEARDSIEINKKKSVKITGFNFNEIKAMPSKNVAAGWVCSCGTRNKSSDQFCKNCFAPYNNVNIETKKNGMSEGKLFGTIVVIASVIIIGITVHVNTRPGNSISTRSTSVSTTSYSSRSSYSRDSSSTNKTYKSSSSYSSTSDSVATSTAKRYLKVMSFSRQGLIDQLEYEGFSTSEATKAVDACDVDWNEQAVLKAKSYLNFTSFSEKGLIEQLEYEGFTSEQAKYGVSKVYVSSDSKSTYGKSIDYVTSNDQAYEKAQSYLRFTAFSKEGLIDQLEYEGFSKSDAEAAVEKLDVDWNEQAVKKAESYRRLRDFSRSELVDQLEYEGFTHSQAVYGADNSD